VTKTSRDKTIVTIGIDIGKNSFHLIGMNAAEAIVLRQKLTRSQMGVRLANLSSLYGSTLSGRYRFRLALKTVRAYYRRKQSLAPSTPKASDGLILEIGLRLKDHSPKLMVFSPVSDH
jgi:hypothetical protein